MSQSYKQGAYAPSSDVAAHPGVAVLGNRALWELITGFMAGYPFVVHEFYQQRDTRTLQSVCSKWHRHCDRVLLGNLTDRKGVLLHLAIATNNLEILRVLFELASHPQYQRDPKVSIKKVMRCAVLFNNVEVLECLRELAAVSNPGWMWEPNLMRLALQRDDPDLEILDWLHAHLPKKPSVLFERDMVFHAKRGDLVVIRWLHEHKRKISKGAVDIAARMGHTEVLRYFYKHSEKRCKSEALGRAAALGHLDAIQFIVENQKKEISQRAINWAATSGHLDVVKYLAESKIRLDAPYVIDNAAVNGHLDIIKYLHEHHVGGCSSRAMHNAANGGHLEVVKFLSENRAEGSPVDALDRAARNGHLEIVKFLYEKSPSLECPAGAFDRAAANGHLEMLQLLYHKHNRNELSRCSANATNWAAKNGHFEIVKFLCEHNLDGDVAFALKSAASRGHFEIVRLLHPRLQVDESAYAAVGVAARRRDRAIVKFLCENQEREPMSFLLQAIAKSDDRAVRAVQQYSSLEELMEAKKCAFDQDKPEIASRIEFGIEAKTRQAGLL